VIEVRLRGRPPEPSRAWDDGRALGQALIAAWPDVRRCSIVVNANRKDVLRWRIGRETVVSVHWALVGATTDVLEVIARKPGAWERLEPRLPSRPLPEIEPRGAVHDLTTILAEQRPYLPVLEPAVAERVANVPVTWARWGRAPSRTLRLGSCSADPPLVRIHPVLDHESVPAWFVGFVVFHELLHLVYPPIRGNGRRIVHPRSFLRAERRHPDHPRALVLEKASVVDWMRRCRAR
jgi:hypothetical protein